MSTAVHQITLEEFLARPDRDDDQREELIEGELIVSPGAKPSHSEIVERLRKQLSGLTAQSYVLRNDFSCILGNHSMPIPDLAVVQSERWNEAIRNDGWLIGSPELVIEVSSPSNRRLERKAAVYLAHGAEQVWLVYPTTKTVKIVTPEGTSQSSLADTISFKGVQWLVSSVFP